MVTFQVSDMTCGHCASVISRAVADLDKDARLDIRIPQKLVRVSSSASATELAEAIQEAGYTPREIREAPVPAAATPATGRCGCGCGTARTAAVEPGQEPRTAAGSCCG